MSPMPESTLSGTLTGTDPGHRSRSGPKTPAGKAAVAGNEITYGIFARAHVLPGVERAEDWLAHRAGILASLAQVDYLDTMLAERAAEYSWKLQRVRRFEAASLRINQPARQQEVAKLLPDRAKHEGLVGFSGLDSLEEDIELAQLQQEPVDQLARAKRMLSSEVVSRWVDSFIEDEGLDWNTLPESVQKLRFAQDDHVSAAAVLQVAKVLAKVVGKPLPVLLAKAREAGKAREATLRKLETWVGTEWQLLEPLQLLPPSAELQLLMRYEAHLSRLLFQTLHEHEARQARRRGEATPLARVDINIAPPQAKAASLTSQAPHAAMTVDPLA